MQTWGLRGCWDQMRWLVESDDSVWAVVPPVSGSVVRPRAEVLDKGQEAPARSCSINSHCGVLAGDRSGLRCEPQAHV